MTAASRIATSSRRAANLLSGASTGSGRTVPCILSSPACQDMTLLHSFEPSSGLAPRSRPPQLPVCLVQRQCMCSFPPTSTGRRGAVNWSQSGSEPRVTGDRPERLRRLRPRGSNPLCTFSFGVPAGL